MKVRRDEPGPVYALPCMEHPINVLGPLVSALLVVVVAARWYWLAREPKQPEPSVPAASEPKEWWRS
jgi:hypothetical protein